MAVGFSNTNKPLNPRGQDASPKGYNRAKLFSGKALDFDGVNDLVTGTASVLPTGANPFTTCFYFNKDADGEAVFWGTRSTNQSNGVGLFSGNKVVHFFYGNDLNSSSNIESGKWYFVAVTFDGTTRSIYINGQFDISDTPTGVNVTGTDYKLGYGGAYYHNGRLANTKVFNVALTAAQVADLYNNPEKVVPTGVDNTALKLWLPMQEGAGTTAYDGSGNGNHGTISGATYVHGIGAPVAQTSVIDWNKGTNLISDSEDFSQWSNLSQFVIYSTDDATAPDGQTTADKITEDTSSNHHRFYKQIVFGTEGGSNQSYTISGFVKYIDRQYISIGLSDDNAFNGLVNFDLVNGTIEDEYTYNGSTFSNKTITDAGNDWWKFSVTLTSPSWAGGSIYAIAYFQQGSSVSTGAYLGESKSVHVWGWNAAKENYITSYVPTFGTAQTSPVLLPQGLTTGRDITGVNLFENVRKQGALNLDGNSWAEVHDNASFDLTTTISMECWAYIDDLVSTRVFFAKWAADSAQRAYVLYQSGDDLALTLSDGSNYGTSSANVLTTGWHHIVATYVQNGNMTYYVDGSQTDAFAFTRAIRTTTAEVEIGRNEGPTGANYFGNQIAQPRIYNRALTAAEVLQNYNSGKNTYTNN